MSGLLTVLVVGATGSVGRLVVQEALRQGHRTLALVRRPGRAQGLPPQAEVVVGDLTRADTLAAAVANVDAVVFYARLPRGRESRRRDRRLRRRPQRPHSTR